ncbi:MAG: YlxR family protein [Firmicutes bacterium]|nr:YlxR family protein [Bacillota bacterium]
MRRCIGCMESKPKNQLIRVACYENEITVDPTGKAKGRGVYLCADEKCLNLARKKRAMQRNFGIEISEEELDRIYQELMEHEEQSNQLSGVSQESR